MASLLVQGTGGRGPAAAPASAPAAKSGAARGGFGLSGGTAAMLQFLMGLYKPEVNNPGLAPLSQPELVQRASRGVAATIDPQLAAVEDANARATAGGVGSIRGGTASYADALKPVAATVRGIGSEQAAEDTAETGALSSFLKGAGDQATGDVAAKMAAAGIGGPAPANLGEGSAGITAAVGLAGARDATAQGGNNADYAALLPGYANLAGQKAENDFRASQAGALHDQETGLLGQVPGLATNELDALRQNETAKAQARSTGLDSRASALGTFLSNDADRQTQLDIANLSGLFGVQKAETAAGKPKIVGSGSTGYYSVDPTTGHVTPIISGKPPASTKNAAVKAKQSALVNADKTTRSIIGSAFTAAAKQGSASAGPFGTGKTAKPEVGSAAYNLAVNKAVKSLETILGPYLSHDDIVKFVQQRALLAGWAPQPPAPGPGAAAALSPFVPTG